MEHQHDHLDEHSIDEPLSEREQQSAQNLRDYYAPEAAREQAVLKRVELRLSNRLAALDQASKLTESRKKSAANRKGLYPMPIFPEKEKRTLVSRIGTIAAVLLVGILAGSMALMLNVSRQGGVGTTGSDSHKATPPIVEPEGPRQQGDVSCPAEGTARKAVMPALQVEGKPALVYSLRTFDEQGTISYAFLRYDTDKGESTLLFNTKDLPGEWIQDTQLSPDGQWIFFLRVSADKTMLQLVRVDGQHLQTLYCAPKEFGGISVSPDQKSLVFTESSVPGEKDFSIWLYHLDIAAGGPASRLLSYADESPALRVLYNPVNWKNDTQLYVLGKHYAGEKSSDQLFLLDLQNGLNQQEENLRIVLPENTICTKDYIAPKNPFLSLISAYGNIIAYAPCPSGEQSQNTPRRIVIYNVDEETSHTAYEGDHDIIRVYMISEQELVFEAQDTIWQIGTDGSKFARVQDNAQLPIPVRENKGPYKPQLVAHEGSMVTFKRQERAQVDQIIIGTPDNAITSLLYEQESLIIGSRQEGSLIYLSSTIPVYGERDGEIFAGVTNAGDSIGWTTI